MSRKWRDALKDWRTYVLGAIFGAVIGMPFSSFYNWLNSWITNWGKDLTVEVMSILVLRTDPNEFPECRIAIHIRNEFSDSKTIAFRAISFLDSAVVCQLTGKSRTFHVLPRSETFDTLVFSDSKLDKYLKFPQAPKTSVFSLVGEITQNKKQIFSRLTNADMHKATYWQVPVLNPEEVEHLDLVPMEHVFNSDYTDSLYEQHHIRLEAKTFTSFWEAMELDMTPLKDSSYDPDKKLIMFSSNSTARFFKKKYGGFYWARFPDAPFSFFSFKDAIPSLSQYNLLKMTGLEYEHGIEDALEFVYFSFDHPELADIFDEYQRNAHYYVILAHDIQLPKNFEYLDPIADSLEAHGFRAKFETDSMFQLLPGILRVFSDSLNILRSIEWLNRYSHTIDSAITYNHPIVVWLGRADSMSSIALCDVLYRFYPTASILELRRDLRPAIYGKNLSAPFSEMVLVYPEFSQPTRSSKRIKYYIDNNGIWKSMVVNPPDQNRSEE